MLLLSLLACGGEEAPVVLPIDTQDEVVPRTASGFQPPTLQRRESAIGSVTGLKPRMRRAFSEEVGYVPIPPPDDDDWLANHDERGQPFDAFVRSGPNIPTDERGTIYLLPIGAFAEEFVVGPDGAVLVPSPPLSQLEEYAEAYFGMPVELLPGVEVDKLSVTSRNHFGRRQLLTSEILKALSRRIPEDAYCLIGVTMEDLYPAPSWNFVFGYASLSERVGVYSFARYDPAFHGQERGPHTGKLILRRGVKVMAHEIGHMFGIEHCTYYSCLMNGTNHLEESDEKPLHLCPVCLRKLQYSVGFDPGDRYRKLQAFYKDVGFEADGHWTRRRVEHIDGHD